MNKLVLAMASLSFVLATATLSACSSSDDDDGDDDASSSSSSSGAASSSSSSGGSSSSSSSSSGGTTTLNGCTTYEDHTADTAVEITWARPLNDANKCSKIKVGTTVTWKGDLVDHPLTTKGGDTPSPITLTNSGTEAPIKFTAAGDFGFVCQKHPDMLGAIQVVE
jgi:plastocyanin